MSPKEVTPVPDVPRRTIRFECRGWRSKPRKRAGCQARSVPTAQVRFCESCVQIHVKHCGVFLIATFHQALLQFHQPSGTNAVNGCAALDGGLYGAFAFETFGLQDAGGANLQSSCPFWQGLVARSLRKDLLSMTHTDVQGGSHLCQRIFLAMTIPSGVYFTVLLRSDRQGGKAIFSVVSDIQDCISEDWRGRPEHAPPCHSPEGLQDKDE